MRLVFATISVWLFFVLALAGWWLVFGLKTLSLVGEAHQGYQLAKHQKMLFYEGSFLMALLLAGGLALFYFSYSMYKEKSAKDKFFATFTHDLKTALFRLQLQVENMGRKKSYTDEEVSLVLSSTRRLHLHLENGLDSTLGRQKSLFLEDINMSDFVSDMHVQWPELSIQLKGSGVVYADRKALLSIFKNLLHNSFVHGEATQVHLQLSEENKKMLIEYKDDGKAFTGDIHSLGSQPQKSTTGTGFGLFLACYWMKRMNGVLRFRKGQQGQLEIEISLPVKGSVS